MKYDVIVIGGGLSGLTCALRLQKSGKKCAVITTGESSLYFSSGTMGLYDSDQPLETIKNLPDEHPYTKIGADRVAGYAAEAAGFFAEAGIALASSPEKPLWRLSPSGSFCRCWAAMDGVTVFDTPTPDLGKKVLVVNFLGYLDFNTAFIAEGISRLGSECRVAQVKLEEMERLRTSATEMRSANIARVFDKEEVVGKFISEVRTLAEGYDTVVLPSVFGLSKEGTSSKIERGLGVRTVFVATMPPSVPGIRTQFSLSRAFIEAGGRYFIGDTVTGGEWDGNTLKSVSTVNLEDVPFEADEFILATGSFFSKGLVATPDSVYDPALGLDVDYLKGRENWYNPSFFEKQNYIGFGVKADKSLRAVRGGVPSDNVYVIGSVLGGANALAEGCGAGVAVTTAFYVADAIISKSTEE